MEIIFKDVCKKYGDFYAVKDLNLTIKSGALHFLLGPSGCGKTTTLRMLAGLESVSSGRILFDGKDVTRVSAADRGVGMVFQNYALWPHMTVYQNIEYGLKLRKLSSAEIKRRINEVLELTKLTDFVSRLPGQLSGGQQQRVALARALAIRPNVLLFDEPLSNLDAKLRLDMRDNITRIHRATQITTVYVTHDQKEALSMGQSVSVMVAGELIQTDSPKKLYDNPSTPFVANFIGESNIIPAKITASVEKGYEVETSFGKLKATRSVGEFSVGDDVFLSIRPESIIGNFLNEDWSGVENKFDLSFDYRTYLGESEQLFLKANDGFVVNVKVFNVPDYKRKQGESTTCRVAPKDVLVLKPQSMDART